MKTKELYHVASPCVKAAFLFLRSEGVVMDLMMPKMNGVDATRLIRAALPQTKVMILTAATRGLTTNDIAKQLDISVSCVLKHFTVIFEKLGVANRAEAVAIAISKQLVKM